MVLHGEMGGVYFKEPVRFIGVTKESIRQRFVSNGVVIVQERPVFDTGFDDMGFEDVNLGFVDDSIHGCLGFLPVALPLVYHMCCWGCQDTTHQHKKHSTEGDIWYTDP